MPGPKPNTSLAFSIHLGVPFSKQYGRCGTVESAFATKSTEPAPNPSRRARLVTVCTSTDGDPKSPQSSPSSSPSPSSKSQESPSPEAVLSDLRDDGSSRQILALVSVARFPPQMALDILLESGILQSRFRNTRIAALNTLGSLKLSSPSGLLAKVLDTDPDHSVRAAAAGALGATPIQDIENSQQSHDSTNASNGAETNHDDEGRTFALQVLRKAAVEDEHFIVRYSSIVALGTLRDANSVALLLRLVKMFEAPALEAAAAIDALSEIIAPNDVSPEVLDAVRARATDTEDLIRAAVARTFDAWRAIPEVAESLPAMLRNELKFGRSSFVLALLQTLIARQNSE